MNYIIVIRHKGVFYIFSFGWETIAALPLWCSCPASVSLTPALRGRAAGRPQLETRSDPVSGISDSGCSSESDRWTLPCADGPRPAWDGADEPRKSGLSFESKLYAIIQMNCCVKCLERTCSSSSLARTRRRLSSSFSVPSDRAYTAQYFFLLFAFSLAINT